MRQDAKRESGPKLDSRLASDESAIWLSTIRTIRRPHCANIVATAEEDV